MWIGIQLFQHLIAVHLRHFNIEQDQIKRLILHHFQSLTAILRKRDLVPLLFQATGQHQPVHAVVINDKDRARKFRHN